jgi:hypothetical protein
MYTKNRNVFPDFQFSVYRYKQGWTNTGLIQETETKLFSPDIPLGNKAPTFVVIITLHLSTFRHIM